MVSFENIFRSYLLVIGRRKMFGEIVREVVETFIPINNKLILGAAILDPVVTHIPGLTAFGFDCFRCKR